MPKQDINYRANPDRGVYVTEQLTQALVAKISPRILDLRKDASAPITVFINSPGGDIRVLDILDGLLRSRGPDGRRNRIITIAIGDANSAAATLLALGDYAIAQKHSRMHFHGSRLPVVEELTAEAASDRAGWLAGLNRSIAMRLATEVMKRLVLRYIRLQPEYPDAQRRLRMKVLNPIACFVDCVKRRVSPSGDMLLDRAIRRMGRLAQISDTLRKAGLKDSDSRLQSEEKVFRAILKFEIREHRQQDWCLDEFGMQDVVADYFLLRDYIFGEHIHHLEAAVNSYGPSFLNEDRFVEYTRRAASDTAEAKRWLRPLVEMEVREFWYLTVCICRLMQEGENSFGASDAYWLGVVDEVLGTDMSGTRQLVERDTPSVPPAGE